MKMSKQSAIDFDTLVERIPVPSAEIKCPGGLCQTYYANQYNFNHPQYYTVCCPMKNASRHIAECDIGTSRASGDPAIAIQSIYYDIDNDHMQCLYDPKLIDTIEQSDAAIDKFGPDNSLSKSFCQSKTLTCPSSDLMKDGCSRYLSIGKDGEYCKNIFAKYSPAEKDAAIRNYCYRNDTADCKCANRSINEDFQKLKLGIPYADDCWYKPCSSPDKFLVPSEFKDKPVCPSDTKELCRMIRANAKIRGVNIDKIKNDVNCDLYPTPNLIGGNTGFKTGDDASAADTAVYYYVIVTVVVVIILIGLVLLITFKPINDEPN